MCNNKLLWAGNLSAYSLTVGLLMLQIKKQIRVGKTLKKSN
jgi:hypothetical protein